MLPWCCFTAFGLGKLCARDLHLLEEYNALTPQALQRTLGPASTSGRHKGVTVVPHRRQAYIEQRHTRPVESITRHEDPCTHLHVARKWLEQQAGALGSVDTFCINPLLGWPHIQCLRRHSSYEGGCDDVRAVLTVLAANCRAQAPDQRGYQKSLCERCWKGRVPWTSRNARYSICLARISTLRRWPNLTLPVRDDVVCEISTCFGPARELSAASGQVNSGSAAATHTAKLKLLQSGRGVPTLVHVGFTQVMLITI